MFQRFLVYLQLDRTFLFLIFLLSYVLVISNRVQAGVISWYTLTPEGPIAQFVSALLIFVLVRYWMNWLMAQKQQYRWQQYGLISLLSLLAYLALSNSSAFVIALAFDTVQRNFNPHTLLANNLSSMVNVVFYGGIYLAYCHFQQLSQYRLQLQQYNQQLAELKIQQLKAQLNPHFVFNSLNTLDELISADPNQASDYLHHFADLYRLSLKNADQKLVSIADELAFSKHYFTLMQVRLGDSYRLQIHGDEDAGAAKIPPFTLQVLLENVFLHNKASSSAPIDVDVALTEDSVTVSHIKRAKTRVQQGNGIGLKNLTRQLHFLTGRELRVDSGEQCFSVTVPLVTKES